MTQSTLQEFSFMAVVLYREQTNKRSWCHDKPVGSGGRVAME
jgi:hypothetical protein